MGKRKTKRIPKKKVSQWKKNYKNFQVRLKKEGCLGTFPECIKILPISEEEIPDDCKGCPHKHILLKKMEEKRKNENRINKLHKEEAEL